MTTSEEIATFMAHLINAGMSIEEATKQGFAFAMELSGYKDGRLLLKKEQMMAAATILERASLKIGVHLDQQEAYKRMSSREA